MIRSTAGPACLSVSATFLGCVRWARLTLPFAGWDVAWPEAFRSVRLPHCIITVRPYSNDLGFPARASERRDRSVLPPRRLSAELFSDHHPTVICPTFWTSSDGDEIGLAHNPECEEVFLDNLIVTRAFENECCVVFVNCGGDAMDGFIGRSGVTLPFKGCVGKAKSNLEE